MSNNIAVIVFNLGGPDKPESVKPFLFNLFNDKNIISAPKPIRYLLAKFISSKREKTAIEIYSHIGGKSPINEQTQEQARLLEEKLNEQSGDEYKVFYAMRYWHPLTEEIVEEVKQGEFDQIILLPLYPHYSYSTTGSSFERWFEIARERGLNVPTRSICCYPQNSDFIKAHHQKIVKTIYDNGLDKKNCRIIFSAHGLPKKNIEAGDPYQEQIEKTSHAVMDLFADEKENMDWVVAYQSKVGPLEWLTPSTENEIERAAIDNKDIVIAPIAFVSEHSETLVELDIEYKKLAEDMGVKSYHRVPALSSDDTYIESLKDMCLSSNFMSDVCSDQGGKICSAKFVKCPCKI